MSRELAPTVVIIGGGITGLSAAWYLEHEADHRGITSVIRFWKRQHGWAGKFAPSRLSLTMRSPLLERLAPMPS